MGRGVIRGRSRRCVCGWDGDGGGLVAVHVGEGREVGFEWTDSWVGMVEWIFCWVEVDVHLGGGVQVVTWRALGFRR